MRRRVFRTATPTRRGRLHGGRARPGRGAALTVGVALLCAGAALGGAAFLAPQTVEKAYGEAKVATLDQLNRVREGIFSELPSVTLGARGGTAELDRCDGTFTEMLTYERDGVPPVWAAHNNCAGDAILGWETGQRITIAGDPQVYEVVEIRYTSKIWSSTDDLIGLSGELALQTCFYGEDRMKFIGLSPAPGSASSTPQVSR